MQPAKAMNTLMDILATQPLPKYNMISDRRGSQRTRSKSKSKLRLRQLQLHESDNDSEKTLLNFNLPKEVIEVSTDTETTLSELEGSRKRWTWFHIQACLTVFNITLFIGTAFCYYETFLAHSPFPWYSKGMNGQLSAFSYYSPLLDVVDVPIKVEQINGSLFPGPSPSIYRLPPSPEVDEAWETVSRVAMFNISTSDVVKLGKDPAKTVRLPESLGFPPETHLAQLDSIHQIHCLNALRKAVFFNYYFDAKKKKKLNRLHWIHLSHCAGIILQNLMCQANLDVITLNWVNTQVNPFPDFSVNKKCRDFGAIKKWQDENKLSEELLRKIVRPKEYVELPSPIQDILNAFKEAKTPWDFDWSSM
ncbi:hypothetical protein H072_4539 [Dactylellina haptotyla CBS 200.50]|uniref:Uncharacterized protein n=1 Tax=Dactylellina haptotyla (strain CBS 200.50) TaxID=1284197 RepID=S8AEQ2_DACHA|nr:hypothetical protein H072_4539 [Dactylellina haptotyla CBS 200.50]